MKAPNKLLRALGIRRMVIKPRAHLFTALSVLWTVFSALGVLLFFDYHRHHMSWIDLVVALIIWAFQVGFIALAIHFWLTERARKVTTI